MRSLQAVRKLGAANMAGEKVLDRKVILFVLNVVVPVVVLAILVWKFVLY